MLQGSWAGPEERSGEPDPSRMSERGKDVYRVRDGYQRRICGRDRNRDRGKQKNKRMDEGMEMEEKIQAENKREKNGEQRGAGEARATSKVPPII